MKSLPLLLFALGAFRALAQVEVPFERILAAEKETGNWLTYSGNYAGHRHSELTQLTPANVRRLKPSWIYQSRESSKWEVTPLVIEGVLYITEAPNVVAAIDGRSGRRLWRYRRPLAADAAGCCGLVNRGLAVLGDALYLCTFDCHLVCLDLNTGKERWDRVVADSKPAESSMQAP